MLIASWVLRILLDLLVGLSWGCVCDACVACVGAWSWTLMFEWELLEWLLVVEPFVPEASVLGLLCRECSGVGSGIASASGSGVHLWFLSLLLKPFLSDLSE